MTAWTRGYEIKLPPGAVKSRGVLVAANAREFPQWTSLHALPLTRRSPNLFCIAFWLLITAVAIGISVWQMAVVIIQYFKYDVSTQSQVAFTQRTFPALTACDLNPYQRSLAYEDAEIARLMSTYVYASKKLACKGRKTCDFTANSTTDADMERYELKQINDSVTLQTKVKRLLVLASAQAENGTLEAARAQQKDFLQGCSFNTQDCYVGDWTEWRDPTMGSCFTFNLNANRTVSRAGPIYGLRQIFKTNVSQYLDSSTSIGMAILVHDQREYPFLDTFGIFVNVHEATEIGISYTTIQRMQSPYGSCRDDKPEWYLYDLDYSTEGCQRSSYQRQIVDVCGCYDPTYPSPKNSSVSACKIPDDVSCWSSVALNASVTDECTEPCEEGSYDVVTSSARWPSGSLSTIGECHEGDYANQTCMDMYIENGAFVEVYFENLSYQTLNESAAITVSTLLSNFGGQVGLWLGMYVLSIAEVIILCFLLVISCISPKIGQPISY
ncbi:hypothetical protein M3Y98_00689100 [Aphelenchoides besseyi]|nr:hypothetical protein M3Y98_00689100 [Aphelenchoides besseyi]KAI6209011.1 hypothetical protein M3Y96_00175900 [Aphelenchoides besseyi]